MLLWSVPIILDGMVNNYTTQPNGQGTTLKWHNDIMKKTTTIVVRSYYH